MIDTPLIFLSDWESQKITAGNCQNWFQSTWSHLEICLVKMTIKDSQRSRCVKLIAELGAACGEVRRKLELGKTCGEATSQPFAQLRGASSEVNLSISGRSCKLARSEAVKELPAMLSNFGFSCETYLIGSCETKCWANLVSLDLLGPSHELFLAYCLLHWISRVQVVDTSPLKWMKNWSSACLPLVFCRCQQVRHCPGQLGILSFLECQQLFIYMYCTKLI